jgi:hypothetical protein
LYVINVFLHRIIIIINNNNMSYRHTHRCTHLLLLILLVVLLLLPLLALASRHRQSASDDDALSERELRRERAFARAKAGRATLPQQRDSDEVQFSYVPESLKHQLNPTRGPNTKPTDKQPQQQRPPQQDQSPPTEAALPDSHAPNITNLVPARINIHHVVVFSFSTIATTLTIVVAIVLHLVPRSALRPTPVLQLEAPHTQQPTASTTNKNRKNRKNKLQSSHKSQPHPESQSAQESHAASVQQAPAPNTPASAPRTPASAPRTPASAPHTPAAATAVLSSRTRRNKNKKSKLKAANQLPLATDVQTPANQNSIVPEDDTAPDATHYDASQDDTEQNQQQEQHMSAGWDLQPFRTRPPSSPDAVPPSPALRGLPARQQVAVLEDEVMEQRHLLAPADRLQLLQHARQSVLADEARLSDRLKEIKTYMLRTMNWAVLLFMFAYLSATLRRNLTYERVIAYLLQDVPDLQIPTTWDLGNTWTFMYSLWRYSSEFFLVLMGIGVTVLLVALMLYLFTVLAANMVFCLILLIVALVIKDADITVLLSGGVHALVSVLLLVLLVWAYYAFTKLEDRPIESAMHWIFLAMPIPVFCALAMVAGWALGGGPFLGVWEAFIHQVVPLAQAVDRNQELRYF